MVQTADTQLKTHLFYEPFPFKANQLTQSMWMLGGGGSKIKNVTRLEWKGRKEKDCITHDRVGN